MPQHNSLGATSNPITSISDATENDAPTGGTAQPSPTPMNDPGYFRFPLSLRMVEEMLAARSIVVSHETVRQWAMKFGQTFGNIIFPIPNPGGVRYDRARRIGNRG